MAGGSCRNILNSAGSLTTVPAGKLDPDRATSSRISQACNTKAALTKFRSISRHASAAASDVPVIDFTSGEIHADRAMKGLSVGPKRLDDPAPANNAEGDS